MGTKMKTKFKVEKIPFGIPNSYIVGIESIGEDVIVFSRDQNNQFFVSILGKTERIEISEKHSFAFSFSKEGNSIFTHCLTKSESDEIISMIFKISVIEGKIVIEKRRMLIH